MDTKAKIDFLAIGDVVTEPFIKLKDATTHCKIDHGACELCVRFGDKVPYESVDILRAVGNSANAAVCAARLGLRSALMSYVGNDEVGKGDIEELAKNNVDTSLVSVVDGYPSNYHYVLWYDVERTILVKHTEFPYALTMPTEAPKWIYLSSLAANSYDYHMQIADYLEAHPEVKFAYQPGTFQMKLGLEKTARLYKRCDLFFCNVEEAQRILAEESRKLPILLDKLHDLGPKIVVITDGIEGAYVRTEDGTKYFMPVYPHEPYERTGAGDAFASTIAASLALGKSIEEAFRAAPVNAMSVTQYVGAQRGLLTQEDIDTYLAKAPENYSFMPLV